MTETVKKTRNKRDVGEKAQAALDIANRQVKRLQDKLDEANAEVATYAAELAAAVARRDYLAANPDLPKPGDGEKLDPILDDALPGGTTDQGDPFEF